MPMSTPDAIMRANEPIRPLRRVEFDRLAAEGFFDDERVELLFGVVVPMTPIGPEHGESTEVLGELLRSKIGDRARVRTQNAFAASEISEPVPDVVVVPKRDYWREHPSRAFLIVEVATSSLRRDRGTKALLYGLADVDEYWVVDQIQGTVEVYRDRHDGEWRSKSTHDRGDTISMLAFPDVEVRVSDILPPIR